MRLAVLPLNALEGTRPAFGRQFIAIAVDILRAIVGDEVVGINYLGQIDSEDGPRTAMINFSDTFIERAMLESMFKQTEAERAIDGIIKQSDTGFEITFRVHSPDVAEPLQETTWKFERSEILQKMHELKLFIADTGRIELPAEAMETTDLGTKDPEAFLSFVEGHDGLYYIQQAGGRVATEFDVKESLDSMLQSLQHDPDYKAPLYELAILARLCTQYRLGTFEGVWGAMETALSTRPDDPNLLMTMGEMLMAIGNPMKAADHYEKALKGHEAAHGDVSDRDPSDVFRAERATIYGRLGSAQFDSKMPVNAERNLRRAGELEADPKPILSSLAAVLQSTGRGHEAVAVFREYLQERPDDGEAHLRLALALIANQQTQEAEKVYEQALETGNNVSLIKRFYAPVLAEKGDLDRAMDFYEDCIEEQPQDTTLLMEYAHVLQAAKRDFEIPAVLKNVLAANPDANTQAQANAWLIELEQPKRVEAVMSARTKLEAGDPHSAIRELKPLRNWLADYWKLWALLSSAYNATGEFAEAEEAANRLLTMFPGCEPGYLELLAAFGSQERHEDAYQLMRMAAGNFPGSVGIHVNLALAAARTGRKEEAMGIAKQIREAVGPNEDLEPVLAEIEKG